MAQASAAPTHGRFWALQHIQTSRGIVSVRQAGSGPNVFVLLHGISSGAGSWGHCALHLADYGRVIAWDAPGYGDSDPLPMAAPKATDYAATLAALVDALGLDNFLLVGHSLGALMAAGYSSLPAPKAFGYALFSPALGYAGSAKSASVRQGRLDALAQKGIEGIAKALPARLLSPSASPDQRQAVTENALKLNAKGYSQAVELLAGDSMTAYPSLTPANTRVYCGDADAVTTPEQSREFAMASGLPFALVHNAGHACHIEQAGQVALLILKAAEALRRPHEA